MLDFIVCWLLVRHVKRVAEMKQHPTSGVIIWAVVTYFGCEILGGVVGALVLGGTGGAVLGAIAGAACGVGLALMHVNNLSDNRMETYGPTSIGPQLVGSSCVGCGQKVVSVVGAQKCRQCGAPCHDDCFAQHAAAHPVGA